MFIYGVSDQAPAYTPLTSTATDVAQKASDDYQASMFNAPATYGSSGRYPQRLDALLLAADNALDTFKEVFGDGSAGQSPAEESAAADSGVTKTEADTEDVKSDEEGSEEADTLGSSDEIVKTEYDEDTVFYTSSGDDDIVINKFIKGLTLNTGDGDDKVDVQMGMDITVNMGKGDDKLIIGEKAQNIYGDLGMGDDSALITGGLDITVNGGAGSDTMLVSGGENIMLNGGTGDDYITIMNAVNVTIDGGEGNDVINMFEGQYGLINGGEGSDIIMGAGRIQGGEGNDYITVHEAKYIGGNEDVQTLITYNAGDGEDTITGVNGNTTIKLNGISKNDVTIKENYKGDGKSEMIITMNDGSGSVTINSEKGSGAKLEFSDKTLTL